MPKFVGEFAHDKRHPALRLSLATSRQLFKMLIFQSYLLYLMTKAFSRAT
jgi:hypothetical protein